MKNYTGALLLLLTAILVAACGDKNQAQTAKAETLYFQISGAT